VEVKSRTWSRKDAHNKAQLVGEILELLGASEGEVVTKDYIEIVTE
jgi:5-methylthioadenosine/S-adenosylhomocysteine deaminase